MGHGQQFRLTNCKAVTHTKLQLHNTEHEQRGTQWMHLHSKVTLCEKLCMHDALSKLLNQNLTIHAAKSNKWYFRLTVLNVLESILLCCSFFWKICVTCVNVQGSMGKPCRYTQFIKTHILCYKSHENQVLQILQSISGTASHTRYASNMQWNQKFMW